MGYFGRAALSAWLKRRSSGLSLTSNRRLRIGAGHRGRYPDSASLEKAERDGSCPRAELGRAQREIAHEFGQMQHGVEFERDRDQGLGAAAVLLGLVQVAGQFESDGNLRGQSAGAADIFVVDRPGFDAVEHSKHPEHIAVRTEQGDGEELADMESGDEIQIRARSLGGVLGDEHIFLLQRVGRDAIVERDIDGTSLAVFDSPSNMESRLLRAAR